MIQPLEKVIQEHLGMTFVVIRTAQVSMSTVTLLFPLPRARIEEFALLLNGATTPGFSWRARCVPLITASRGLELHGTWAAIEVTRGHLRGAPEQA